MCETTRLTLTSRFIDCARPAQIEDAVSDRSAGVRVLRPGSNNVPAFARWGGFPVDQLPLSGCHPLHDEVVQIALRQRAPMVKCAFVEGQASRSEERGV